MARKSTETLMRELRHAELAAATALRCLARKADEVEGKKHQGASNALRRLADTIAGTNRKQRNRENSVLDKWCRGADDAD